MGRPKTFSADRTAVQVRLEPEEIAALDEMVTELQAETTAGTVSRSSAIRHVLIKTFEERRAKKTKR